MILVRSELVRSQPHAHTDAYARCHRLINARIPEANAILRIMCVQFFPDMLAVEIAPMVGGLSLCALEFRPFHRLASFSLLESNLFRCESCPLDIHNLLPVETCPRDVQCSHFSQSMSFFRSVVFVSFIGQECRLIFAQQTCQRWSVGRQQSFLMVLFFFVEVSSSIELNFIAFEQCESALVEP